MTCSVSPRIRRFAQSTVVLVELHRLRVRLLGDQRTGRAARPHARAPEASPESRCARGCAVPRDRPRRSRARAAPACRPTPAMAARCAGPPPASRSSAVRGAARLRHELASSLSACPSDRSAAPAAGAGCRRTYRATLGISPSAAIFRRRDVRPLLTGVPVTAESFVCAPAVVDLRPRAMMVSRAFSRCRKRAPCLGHPKSLHKRYVEVLADLPGKVVEDFGVSRNCGSGVEYG